MIAYYSKNKNISPDSFLTNRFNFILTMYGCMLSVLFWDTLYMPRDFVCSDHEIFLFNPNLYWFL